MLQELPLSAITCLDHLQQRTVDFIDDKNDLYRQQANLSATIIEVKGALANGQSIRIPLDIHEVDGKYLLVDGHHRYQGALAYCNEEKVDPELYQVPVNITKNSTEQAAIDASFTVNLNHGVGLTPAEVKQVFFRSYVWSRSVPKLNIIRANTSCAQGTASNIAKAARWCIERIEQGGVDIETPPQLKAFMTKEMETLGISSEYLDGFGLPSYSLIIKALAVDNYVPNEVDNLRDRYIEAVTAQLSDIETKYGVEVLREGLRKHKTKAHGITVTQHNKWLDVPTTASLLAKSSGTMFEF